jgi:peptidoglycan/LPS O-acetylase OafA/YrhL
MNSYVNPTDNPTDRSIKSVPRPAASAGEIQALTSLRGFAACWVVAFHFKTYFRDDMPAAVMWFIDRGFLAVDFFFVLSGFVLYITYVDRITNGTTSFVTFMVRRFARIYPLHLLMLLVYLVFVAALTLAGAGSGELPHRYGVGAFALNLMLMQGWGILTQLTWNEPSWSISAELGSYLAFPPLVLIGAVSRHGLTGLIAVIAAAMACLYILFHLLGSDSLGVGVAQLGLIRCTCQFVMGMACGEVYRRYRHRLAQGHLVAGALLALATIAAISTVTSSTLVIAPLLWVVVIVYGSISSGHIGRFLQMRLLVYIGTISYSIYLFHYIVFDCFKLLCVRQDYTADGRCLLASFLIILAGSAVLFHCVEKPAQNLINNWYNGMSKRPSGAARHGSINTP